MATRKAKSLGVLTNEDPITLPLTATVTGRYKFYYQLNGVTKEETITCVAGESIEVPNRFNPNQTYEVWVKDRRRVYVRDTDGFNVFLLSVGAVQVSSGDSSSSSAIDFSQKREYDLDGLVNSQNTDFLLEDTITSFNHRSFELLYNGQVVHFENFELVQPNILRTVFGFGIDEGDVLTARYFIS